MLNEIFFGGSLRSKSILKILTKMVLYFTTYKIVHLQDST